MRSRSARGRRPDRARGRRRCRPCGCGSPRGSRRSSSCPRRWVRGGRTPRRGRRRSRSLGRRRRRRRTCAGRGRGWRGLAHATGDYDPTPASVSSRRVRCACIDIGSNTTRLLVAEPARDGRLRELTPSAPSRGWQPPGARRGDPARRRASGAEVVAEQVAAARAEGVASIRVVATAAIRDAANRDDFTAAVHELAGLTVEVLERRGGGAPRLPRRHGVARRVPRRPARRRRRRRPLVRARGGDARRGRRLGDLAAASGRGCSPTSTCTTIRRRRPSSTRSARTSPACSRRCARRSPSRPTRSAAARRRCGACWAPCSTRRRCARAPRARRAAPRGHRPPLRAAPRARAPAARRDPAPRGRHGRVRNPAADVRRRPARGRPPGRSGAQVLHKWRAAD